ncbi:MAG: hypothetical protein ACM4D3_24000 [Candidatus Sericytochromatia bacterium]
MFKHVRHDSEQTSTHVAVSMRVRVYPGTDTECRGVIVEDFGEMVAQSVDLGGQHFADPARQWAAALDTGGLVFADTAQTPSRCSGNLSADSERTLVAG